jgi:putative endonuclease
MYERSYYTYIVRCSDGSYYTGITNNPKGRVLQHNEGTNSKSYTFTRRPVALVYAAEFFDVYEAIHWEKIVKGWSRKKKEALIQGDWENIAALSKKIFPKKKNNITVMLSSPAFALRTAFAALRPTQSDKGGAYEAQPYNFAIPKSPRVSTRANCSTSLLLMRGNEIDLDPHAI